MKYHSIRQWCYINYNAMLHYSNFTGFFSSSEDKYRKNSMYLTLSHVINLLFRECRHILLLILSKCKRINQLLFSLKSLFFKKNVGNCFWKMFNKLNMRSSHGMCSEGRHFVKYARIRVFSYTYFHVQGQNFQFCPYTVEYGSDKSRILTCFTQWALV